MYAGITNKKNRKHKSKKVVPGKCVFPFKYKRKEYDECLDTGNGPWCPTSLTKLGTVNTWGYCLDPNISNKIEVLTNPKINPNTSLSPGTKQMKLVGNPKNKSTMSFSSKTKKIKLVIKPKNKSASNIKPLNITNSIRAKETRNKVKYDKFAGKVLEEFKKKTIPFNAFKKEQEIRKKLAQKIKQNDIMTRIEKMRNKSKKKHLEKLIDLPGFYLFKNAFDLKLENKIINIIDTDPRFIRSFNNGKIFYQMGPEHFPKEWKILLEIISKLHPSCVDYDYSLQLKYQPGIRFNAHYDSKHRWEEFIVGVNLKSEAELYFTKKDTPTITKKIPPRSIYILSGDSRYKWRHGIKKVKELRYSITFRKKTEKEKQINSKQTR